MITLADYLMERDVKYPPSDELIDNANDLLERINGLEEIWGKPLIVTSGYRPAEMNAAVAGSASKSKHITCQAVDLRDIDQSLSKWLVEGPEILIMLGLWMESPLDTVNSPHVHLQSVAPGSGNRIFRA